MSYLTLIVRRALRHHHDGALPRAEPEVVNDGHVLFLRSWPDLDQGAPVGGVLDATHVNPFVTLVVGHKVRNVHPLQHHGQVRVERTDYDVQHIRALVVKSWEINKGMN